MDFLSLIDQDAKAAADSAFATVQNRVTNAQASLTAAEAAVAAAKKASAAAISAGGDGIAEEEDIAAAEIKRSAAIKVLSAAQAALSQAKLDYKAAAALAWRPVFWAGIAQRLQACASADQARQALADADSSYIQGGVLIDAAANQGYGLSQMNLSATVIRPLTDEQRTLSAHQIDFTNQLLGWEK